MTFPAAFLLTLAAESATAPPPAPPRESPVFRFETDELWLNLHHFLYVLGRAEAKTKDAAREAVVRAPGEARQGLAGLTEEERKIWTEAVHAYAAGPSQKDAVFDAGLAAATRALAAADDAPALPATGLDPGAVAALERAAPIYRKAFWPAHRAANREWLAQMEPLLARHGPEVFAFVRHAYGMPWPVGGYAIHLSRYANWAGAYSTEGDLLVVATGTPATRGLHGLEIVFHESMHQWDDAMEALLADAAKRAGKPVPPALSHALVFFTAGEAVRHAVPQHVPYAEAFRVWDRGLQPMRAALVERWKPWLLGKGSRDEALAAMLEKLAETGEASTAPASRPPESR
jgi:hypothetical protein